MKRTVSLKHLVLGTLVVASLAVGGAASATSTPVPAITGISLLADFGDYGLDYATTGASQIRGDGSSRTTDCSTVNTTSSSASLAVPANGTKVKAYLYWVGLEQHAGRGYSNAVTLNNTVVFTPAGGTATTVTAAKRSVAGVTNSIRYASYEADVTSLIRPTIAGTYSVAISGGIPGLCSYYGENARAWQLVVVYDTPALEFSKVYVYDGLDYLQYATRTANISGYIAPPAGRNSTLTAFVAQGDAQIPGEYATTSDAQFPDYPTNFANSTVNGSAVNANGFAIDIDTLSGPLTPGSTSMSVQFGSNGDVIVPTTFVLKVASLWVPSTNGEVSTTTTTVAATTTTTVPPTTTTTVAPTTTTTVPPTTTTTVPPTTTVAPTTTTVAVAPTTVVPTPTTTVAPTPPTIVIRPT